MKRTYSKIVFTTFFKRNLFANNINDISFFSNLINNILIIHGHSSLAISNISLAQYKRKFYRLIEFSNHFPLGLLITRKHHPEARNIADWDYLLLASHPEARNIFLFIVSKFILTFILYEISFI